MIHRIGDYKNDIPFSYENSLRQSITDGEILDWIKSLRIPPAYRNVQIVEYAKRNSKILAFGFDSKGRKQYIYNPIFVSKMSVKKYKKILKLDREGIFDAILQLVIDDMCSNKDLKTKEIAMILYLIITCGFRVGNKNYEKLHGSYGISTIKFKHIVFDKNGNVAINFIGKKGVRNESSCNHHVIYKYLMSKKRKYRQDDAVFGDITSSDVNDYLKVIHPEVTTKDLRTWNANMLFKKYVKEAVAAGVKNPVKKSIEKVAEQLHNTLSVCKKNYIDPYVIETVSKKIKK
jgi:DNA topoisomerase-1